MTAVAAPVFGFKGKAYYNSATHASPTWVLVANVGDIKVTDERNEKDIDLRSQNGFAITAIGTRKYSFEFSMLYDPADAVQTALRAIWWAGTANEWQLLDDVQTNTSASGVLAYCVIAKFARQEAVNDAFMVDVAIKPTYADGVTNMSPTRVGTA